MHFGRIKRMVSMLLCVIMLSSLLQVREASASCNHNWGSWTTVLNATCTTGGTQRRTCSKCKKTESKNISPLGHNSSGSKSTSATCTEPGYSIKYCTRCSSVQSRTVSQSALGHSWGGWSTTRDATCTTGGTKQHKCTRCGKTETANISPYGHNSSGSKSTSATCTEAGYSIKYCTRCSSVQSRTVSQNALGHSWGSWTTTKEATCTVGGTKQHKCNRCGKIETANIAPLGHNSDKTKTVAATCTTDGYTEKLCSRCSSVMSRTVIKATGVHTWGSWVMVKSPTCTEGGTRKHTCTVCGQTASENVAPLGHNADGTKTVAPTCDTEGYTAKTCTRCGTIVSKTAIAVPGHSWSSWTVTKEATCTIGGSKQRKCTKCGKTETANIAPLGHNSDKTKTVAATCGADGYTEKLCSRCSSVMSRTVIPATGNHTWGGWTTVKSATCTEGGTRKHTCTVCGKTASGNLSPLGHNSDGTKTVAATCDKEGYNAVTCSRCGIIVSKTTIPATGHKWSGWSTTKEATCTIGGLKQHKCSKCGKTESANIAPLGHNSDKTKTVQPTCGTDGYTEKLCSRCSSVMSRTVLKATGQHTWGDWIPVKNATCTEGGTRRHTCTKCGATASENIAPKGHTWGNWTVTKAVTCTEEGTKKRSCSTCGVSATEKITAPGHNWGAWSDVKSATCTEGGVKKRSCTKCGKAESENVAALGHSVSGVKKTVAATCTADGYTAIICNRCNMEMSRTVIPSPGHTWGDWESVKKETCTEDGTRKHTCTACGLTAVEKVSAPGHSASGVKKTVKPTCTIDGYTAIICNNCGKEMSRSVQPALGHKWNTWETIKNETCDQTGLKSHTCERCNLTVTETIPAKQHSVTGQHRVIKKATCEEDGYEAVICNNCGKAMEGNKVIPATGHKFGMVEEIIPATCQKTGTGIKHCTNPGCTYSENAVTPKKDHYPMYFNEPATCFREGKKGTRCMYCGEIYGEYTTTPKTGHNYGEWIWYEDLSKKTGENVYFRYCKDCGVSDQKTEPIEEDPEYYIIFDANGGTGKMPMATFSGSKYYELPDCKFKKTACVFRCWSTSPDPNSGFGYNAGSTIQNTETPVTLYAIWDPIIYHITWHYNFTNCPDPINEDIMYGVETQARVLKREGYKIVGWKGYTDGGKQLYFPAGQIVKNLTVNNNVTIHLYAQWEKVEGTYRVNYYDGDKFIETDSADLGTAIKMKKYYKNGWYCMGWSTTPDGAVDYYLKTKYTFTADVNLYAVWYHYTVSYDANGGVGAPASQTVKDGSYLKLSMKEPTRTGYKFEGWSYKKTEQNLDFQPGDVYDAGENITLYAVWDPIEYTLKLDYGYPGAKPYSTPMPYDFVLYLPTPVRDGYTFAGWKGYTDGGKPLNFSGGTAVSKLTSNENVTVVLKGSWVRAEGYTTVTCMDGSTCVASAAEKTGKAIKMPYYSDPKTSIGVTSWNTKPDGSGTSYNPGKKYTITESITVYAIWGKYSITYHANKGTGAPAKQDIPNNSTARISTKEPSRTGYIFGGWAFQSDATDSDFKGGDEYKDGVSIDLYAVWKPIEYTVTFNPGYVGAPKINNATGVYDYNVYMPKPERTGFKFTGWKGYYDGKSLWFPGDSLAKNITYKDGVVIQLTAQFERIEGYCKLSFYSDDKMVITDAVKYGDTFKIPNYYESKTGTFCVNWDVKQNGVTKTYKEGTKITVTEDMQFYANWGTYTIRFEPNGTGVKGMPNYIKASKSKAVSIPDNIPTRDGYRFAGWGSMDNQGIIVYTCDPGEPYDVAVDITLYAMWDEIIISPLKEVLQKKYSPAIMKDEYFDRDYMSSGWQKISDRAYFLIKTDTSMYSYDTDAFIIYKDANYNIRVEEYTDFEGVMKTLQKTIVENTDNDVGAALTFTLDFAVDLAKDFISNSSVPGKIAVYSYDAYCLIKEFLEEDEDALFDTVEYATLTGLSVGEEYIIKFTVESGVSVSSIISFIYNGVKKMVETEQIEKLNLDPLGDRDAALKEFASSIAKKGWSSAVYDTGLREVVNKLYGK